MASRRTLARSGPQPSLLSRRKLLTWMGNATVLTLGPDLLIACGGGDRSGLMTGGGPAGASGAARGNPLGDSTGGAGGDGSLSEASAGSGGVARGASGGAAGQGATSLPSLDVSFEPTEPTGAIYDDWWGNTVDPQNVSDILASWQLRVDGLVERATTLSFAQLLDLPRQDQTTDFHCVEGWSVLDVPWNGLHFDTLIELVRPSLEATHVTFECFGDIYSESLPLEVAREPRTLLAYGIGSMTLPLTHGFPLRLIVPRLFGYKSAKCVKRIEFTNAPQQGYWEQRGYTYEAEVQAARLREGKY